jgi:GNAT superfamily N-acetyltransferase
MSQLQLIEVTTPQLARDFLEVNVLVNRGNPNYIRPLDKDVDDVFDAKKNKTFRFGTVTRWVLRKDDALIGRIAAFTNKKYKNKGDDVPVGGVGFFDCINDPMAAEMLLNVAKHWLIQQGMQAMDGPINFGERDRWWGLVVEGFQSPLYCMNYNPPYYQALLEGYGFQPFFHQICFGKNPKQVLSEKVRERHAQYEKDPAFQVRTIDTSKLPQYAADFATIYNAAWAGHGGLKEMKAEQVMVMFKKMKPVMDPRIIWFAYHNDRPIALFVNLPDLNQWFRHLDGKFGLGSKLKFLWVKATKKCTKFSGIVFGVVPDFQGKGIDSFIVGEAYKTVKDMAYEEYEMQWIGDFNPKMINVAQGLGDVHQSRKLTTYRYLFDRTKEFVRHPILS